GDGRRRPASVPRANEDRSCPGSRESPEAARCLSETETPASWQSRPAGRRRLPRDRFEPATVARGAGSSRCLLPRGDAKRQRFIRRDHFRGIGPGLWPELFGAPAEGLGRIQIALRVDRKLVNAPESARELTEGAPRVEEMAGL